jgi:dihydrofolate reductase
MKTRTTGSGKREQMQIPRPDEHERRRLRGHAGRVASADRRPSLRLRQEPRHQEFVKGCQAALMGRTTFEPALTNDRWPWPNLNVSCSVPSARGAPDHVVSDHDPPRLPDKLRAASRGGDVDLVGGPRTIETFRALGAPDTLELVVLPLLSGAGMRLTDSLSPDIRADVRARARPSRRLGGDRQGQRDQLPGRPASQRPNP